MRYILPKFLCGFILVSILLVYCLNPRIKDLTVRVGTLLFTVDPTYTKICAKEQKHLYFLKVHKAGSTTIQNLFLRFALVRHLNVLTIFASKDKGIFCSYPKVVFDDVLPPTPTGLANGKYDIYCEHSIFNEKYLRTKLHDDTINIAITREPVSRLRSAFNYYHLHALLGLKNSKDPVGEFLKKPGYFLQKSSFSSLVTLWDKIGNRVAREFGYDPFAHKLREYLPYIESRFLVLIFERLPESLVVMKRKLCWGMKDILYSHARQGSYTKPREKTSLVKLPKVQSPPNYSRPKTYSKLHKAWFGLDYKFYNYFRNVMERTITDQDPDFHEEVALFQQCLTKTTSFCDVVCSRVGALVTSNSSRESIASVLHNQTMFPANRWDSGFVLTGLDCLMMRFNPQVFRDIQKVRLFLDYCLHNSTTLESLNIRAEYCNDHFEHSIPWFVILRPRFVSKCY